MLLCTSKNTIVSANPDSLCARKNVMRTISLSVCVHISIHYVLSCKQVWKWRSSVYTAGFLCTQEYIMECQGRWSRSDHSNLSRTKNLAIYGKSLVFSEFWSDQSCTPSAASECCVHKTIYKAYFNIRIVEAFFMYFGYSYYTFPSVIITILPSRTNV